MNSNGQMDGDALKMQNAMNAYLRTRTAVDGSNEVHLDEDVLTAFVEGNLNPTESLPVVSHLSDCSYCRHISAELIRLETVFAEEAVTFERPASEPQKVGEVLSGILSKIFGSGEGAVFAHEEREDSKEDKSIGDEEE